MGSGELDLEETSKGAVTEMTEERRGGRVQIREGRERARPGTPYHTHST